MVKGMVKMAAKKTLAAGNAKKMKNKKLLKIPNSMKSKKLLKSSGSNPKSISEDISRRASKGASKNSSKAAGKNKSATIATSLAGKRHIRRAGNSSHIRHDGNAGYISLMGHNSKSFTSSMKSGFRELALEFGLLLYFMAVIALFWIDNLLSFVFCLIGTAIAFFIWHDSKDIVFFFVAAAIGTLTEIFMVSIGVHSYVKPFAFGVPAWLPFFWGNVFLFIRRFKDTFFRIEGIKAKLIQKIGLKGFEYRVFLELFIYLIVLAIIVFFKHNDYPVLFLLGFVSVLQLSKWHYYSDYFFFFITMLIVPVFIELWLYAGIIGFARTSITGFPLWLAIEYAIISLIIRRLSVSIIALDA